MVKNVLFVCSVYKPNIGGIETTIEQLSKYYQSKGIDTKIFTKRYPFNLPEEEMIDGSQIFRMSRPKIDSEFLNSAYYLKNHLTELQADIVHIIGIRRPLPLHGLLISKLLKVPYVVTFAGSDIPNIEEPDTLDLWEEGKDVVPQSILQADSYIAFSKDLKKLAQRTLPSITNIKVLHAGIDFQLIQNIQKHVEKFPYIIAARRLHSSKGLDLLIQAFSTVHNIYPELKLFIIGDGQERENLEILTNKLHLQDNIIFTGALSPVEVFSYLKGAIASLCPSITEGGGLINLEAQAASCLAIGSDAGGIPEYISHMNTGLIFPAGDKNALGDCIITAYKNEHLRNQINKQAKDYAKKFDWGEIGEAHLQLYSDVIKNYEYKSFNPWSKITEEMWKVLQVN